MSASLSPIFSSTTQQPSGLVTKRGKEVPDAKLYFMTKPFSPGVSPFICLLLSFSQTKTPPLRFPDFQSLPGNHPGFAVVATVLTTEDEAVALDGSVTLSLAGHEFKTPRRPSLNGFWIQEFRFWDVHPESMVSFARLHGVFLYFI